MVEGIAATRALSLDSLIAEAIPTILTDPSRYGALTCDHQHLHISQDLCQEKSRHVGVLSLKSFELGREEVLEALALEPVLGGQAADETCQEVL